LILLGLQNLWNLINVFIQKKIENVHLSVSHDFVKVCWVQKNQSVMFLVVPPKDGLAQHQEANWEANKTKFCSSMVFYNNVGIWQLLHIHIKTILTIC
jgi:hypothetical protein